MNRAGISCNAPVVVVWRRTVMAFALSALPAFAVLATPMFSGCESSHPVCDLDIVLKQRAGAGATDCGRVPIGGSSTITDRCIADQTARGAPFYARYDVQGIDSAVSLGALRDASGRSAVLLWDSDPSGGGHIGARITETQCGGDPPIRTMVIIAPSYILPVDCGVAMSVGVICDS